MNTYGRRIIHDAALLETAKVKEIIFNGTWRWPNQNATSIAHLMRNTPVNFLPAKGGNDIVIWIGNNSHKYTVRDSWDHIRRKKKR